MQLSPQSIDGLSRGPNPLITPIVPTYRHEDSGLSGGMSCAGYDVHMGEQLVAVPMFNNNPFRRGNVWVLPARTGCLAYTTERFHLPNDLAMHYYNKSSLARQFISACATLGEPGWNGHLTLELYNQSDVDFKLYPGQPIGQVVFLRLDMPSEHPYKGKYQGQAAEPVMAR